MTTLTQKELKERKYRGKYTVERFWEKVHVRKIDECWPWTGCVNWGGYGTQRIKNDHWLAHRLSWTLQNGDIPKGLYVLHKCDNRRCCNPLHLDLGTYFDNLHDAMNKGRWWTHRGEKVGTSVLLESEVLQIKTLWNRTPRPTKAELARKFSVSETMIRNIVTEKFWRHVQIKVPIP